MRRYDEFFAMNMTICNKKILILIGNSYFWQEIIDNK